MATVVLATVGGIVAGPVGAAIGAAAGYAIDSRVLSPRVPTGPRLGDRAVQTSAYGTAIPKLFGRLRVAGTVIWATDIREDQHKAGGGKGGGKGTAYSYSVSLAVALSGRPVRAVHRIWADGKLLRGAAGDWKSDLGGYRLHLGDGSDGVDPLIASIEGGDATPAYDDLAYVVFDTLQLADFGNRIPSLTFEVEADAGAVPVATIAEVLSDGAAGGDGAASLGGYAASGSSVRGALATLIDVFALSVRDGGDRLVITEAASPPVALAAIETGAGDADGVALRTSRAAARSVIGEVQLSYYDPALDWQAGLQRARNGARQAPVEAIDLAAALAADGAKALVEGRLATLEAGRDTATIRLPWRRLDLRPGDQVTLPNGPARWRITSTTLDATATELSLRALADFTGAGATGSAGRPVPAPDLPAGPTCLRVLDLPALGDGALAQPRVIVAAAGADAGWRPVDLLATLDGGASWQPLGRSAPAAVMGNALTTLPAGKCELFDEATTVDVELLGDGMWLAGASDDALVGGANCAALGDELIQFGHATPLGERRFRLGRLLRGRRGSEAATFGHAPGEPFVLLDPATLLNWDLPLSALGTTVRLAASGRGDPAPVVVEQLVTGRSVKPPAPARLAAARSGDGAIAIGWCRRSRAGWLWASGGDVPLVEERELYRLEIERDGRALRTITCAEPQATYDAGAQAQDGVAGAVTFRVSQVGTVALGEPAAFTLPPE